MLPFLGQDQMSVGVAEHQDMLLTINNSISEKAPPAIEILSPHAHPSIIFHMIISFHCLKLTLLNTVSDLGDIFPLRNGRS